MPDGLAVQFLSDGSGQFVRCEGLLDEISEKNGKKRVFIRDEIKAKMRKYAKVRISKKR